MDEGNTLLTYPLKLGKYENIQARHFKSFPMQNLQKQNKTHINIQMTAHLKR